MIGVEIQVHEIAEDEDSDEEEFRPPPIHHGRDMAPERPPTPQKEKEKALSLADDGRALFLTPDATVQFSSVTILRQKVWSRVDSRATGPE